MKQEIPWNRLAVEAIVIVGSILLAFAIDAWWEERTERIRLRAAIENVIDEVRRDREEIDSAVLRNRRRINGLISFLSLSPEELENSPDFVAIARGFDHPSSFDSTGISLQSLLIGGNLELIAGGELVSALLEWAQFPAEIESDYEEALELSFVLFELLAPYGVHLEMLNALAGQRVPGLPMPMQEALRGISIYSIPGGPTAEEIMGEIRRDREIAGTMAQLVIDFTDYTNQLERGLALADRVAEASL